MARQRIATDGRRIVGPRPEQDADIRIKQIARGDVCVIEDKVLTVALGRAGKIDIPLVQPGRAIVAVRGAGRRNLGTGEPVIRDRIAPAGRGTSHIGRYKGTTHDRSRRSHHLLAFFEDMSTSNHTRCNRKRCRHDQKLSLSLNSFRCQRIYSPSCQLLTDRLSP